MAARYPEALELADPIVGQINQFFDRVVACVDHRRRTLIAEVVDKRLEMAARVTHRAQKEAELMTVKGDVERKIKNNELRDLQERMLAEIEAKLAEVRLPHLETHLVFQGECEQLEQLILNVGDVLEEEVAVIPRYQEMRKVVEVGERGKNPGELSNPRCVAIDENTNHIYVTELDPARVSVFSESGEFLNTFTHEHMKQPYGIAIHLNNVYITDVGVHGVFQFKIESDMRLVARLGGKGSEDGKFNLPRQLTVSANGDVFVADYHNHRIQILDENLYHQRSIKHDSMQYPRDVKLTNDQMFVLTNSSPCVHEFSIAGEKIRSFITQGQGMQVTRACCFCLDALKNLIISDALDRSVKIFSPDGTLLHSIGGFQDGSYYYSPCGIALTKQLKIVVIAPNDTFMLQIFSCD